VFRRDGEFSAIPMQPIQASDGEAGAGGGSETFLRIKLGNEVWVHQGEKFEVRLRGGLDARLGEETRLEGKIELSGGSLDVSGKRFEIETGTITLAGPVETALVTATARWDSPAGYSVYADFSGTVSDGKLELRSEPPLGRDEILSLLLFGTPDGNVGSGSGDNASTAASLAGDTAAAGLNQLLSRFTELDVSARIDTSTGSARPELVLQVTPRLTARVTRALGEPVPGQSPDRTFFTLELRLRQRWSLATIVGDHGGTALEIVWRLRY
jgi:autotransporter translocation and assembly factor TamB